MRDKNDGVSEVVGVMLLLTITILVVSIVALSATELIDINKPPLSTSIIAVNTDDSGTKYTITMENVAGDAFSLDWIRLIIGVRNDATRMITLDGSSEKILSVSGDTFIRTGDQFKLLSDEKGKFVFGSFSVAAGEYLTYQFYDPDTGICVSSGEIQI